MYYWTWIGEHYGLTRREINLDLTIDFMGFFLICYKNLHIFFSMVQVHSHIEA